LPFFFSQAQAQDSQRADTKGAVAYLVKNVLLRFRDTGAVVLVRHSVSDIKHPVRNLEVQYWNILKKYFPGVSKDSLYRKVESAPWIDTTVKVSGFRIFYPRIKAGDKFDYRQLFREFDAPVYSISNPMFSNDNTVCVFYLGGFEAGGFTVEIKKDTCGKWASFTTTTDWLE
jgi:hypothetical protein